MAKITRLPPAAIIGGFKGKVDYYIHCGQPCARSWPRSPGHDRAPTVEKGWPAFTWAVSNWNALSPAVQEAYNQQAQGTKLTGRDIFVKSFITTTHISLE